MAFDIYFKDGFTLFLNSQEGYDVAFQSGDVLLSSNTMVSEDFKHLCFLGKMRIVVAFDDLELTYREPGMPDHLLSHLYFGCDVRAVLGRR